MPTINNNNNMPDALVILLLARLSYTEEFISSGVVDTTISHGIFTKKLKIFDHIDEIESYTNGLQAVAYLSQDDNKLYIIIRGADIGIGKDIFRILGADSKYLPTSSDENKFRAFIQDWLYSAFLAGNGLVPMKQRDSLEDFVLQVSKKYPSKEVIIAGSSLGGALAQAAYIKYPNLFNKCITYSAMSPWRILTKKEREVVRSRNFLKDVKKMVSYYTNSDLFRIHPIFPRYIGPELNIALTPFKTQSNVFATILEWMGWSHMMKYVKVGNNGLPVPLPSQESVLQQIYGKLNQKFEKNIPFNIGYILLVFILTTGSIFGAINILQYLPHNISFISFIENFITNNHLFVILLTILFTMIVTLPVTIIKSKWKLLMVMMLSLSIMFPLLWPVLLVLSFLINTSAD